MVYTLFNKATNPINVLAMDNLLLSILLPRYYTFSLSINNLQTTEQTFGYILRYIPFK